MAHLEPLVTPATLAGLTNGEVRASRATASWLAAQLLGLEIALLTRSRKSGAIGASWRGHAATHRRPGARLTSRLAAAPPPLRLPLPTYY